MYLQSIFRAKIRKKYKKIHLKMNIFTAVKYCCILHGRVFVMQRNIHLNLIITLSLGSIEIESVISETVL